MVQTTGFISNPWAKITTHTQIRSALLHLTSVCDGAHSLDGVGFNKLDRDFGYSLADRINQGKELSFNQHQSALKLLRKYKKQLKAVSIELPTQKELDCFLKGQEAFEVEQISEDEYQVKNLLKGSGYTVTSLIDGEILQCDCPLTIDDCKHTIEVRKYLAASNEPIEEYEPNAEESIGGLPLDDSHLIERDELDRYDEYLEATDYYELEDYSESEIVPVSVEPEFETILDGVILNEGQKRALSEIARWLDGPEKFYLLTGFAGTGKSVTLQALITLLRKYGDLRSIVFTAPTNKAVKVLARMATKWNLDLEAMTCHKLLGLRPKKREKRLEFEPDPKEDPKFDCFRLVIVDEVSMLNESMWYILADACKLGQKILFVGDQDQAPPVNEALSRAFYEIGDRSTLTEIVRYSGAVGQLVEKVRQAIGPASVLLPDFEAVDEGEKGVWVYDRRQWEVNLIRQFKSDEYKLDPDHCRAIAYTNKRVDELNRKVREAIYGLEAPQFIVGERLIAQEAYSQDETVIIPTSEECTILSAHEGTSGSWAVWYLQVKLDSGEIRTVPVLKSEECDRFNKRLNELAEDKRWFDYWYLRECFADLRYPFCITAHKCQGSTYGFTYLDIGNFTNTFNWIIKGKSPEFRQQKLRERNKLLYTAMSRAAKRLYILQ